MQVADAPSALVETCELLADRCVECGERTYVYRTVSPFRYRKCARCGKCYKTQEVRQGEVDNLVQVSRLALGALNALADMERQEHED